MPTKKLRQLDLLAANCHLILSVKDEDKLAKAVNYIGASASKREKMFLNEILTSGVYNKLLIVRVLRTVSLIATRLERPSDFDIMFQKGHLDSVLRIVESGEAFVQLQALHLISELGIGQEKELKQRVLEGGAVPAIVECYNRLCASKSKGLNEDVVSQCGNALYKLASTSTPQQFVYFREAIPTFVKLLSDHWTVVVDTASALSFLIHENHPEFIEELKLGKVVDEVLHVLQHAESKDTVRWHCCMVVWAIARHCDNKQLNYLFKATGILCQLFQDERADPHLRAAALNTMQVLLNRSDIFVSQFVNFRDSSFLSSVIEKVRSYKHNRLVLPGDSADSVMKYASFALLSAISGADKELMLRLLEASAYPLIFKILAIEGEVEALEESKLRALAALERVLDVCENEVGHFQASAERKKFDASASWQLVRSLANGFALPLTGATTGAGAGRPHHKLHWKRLKQQQEQEEKQQQPYNWSEPLREAAKRALYSAQALLLVPL